MAIIDCTREIVAWHFALRLPRRRGDRLGRPGAAVHAIEPGELTLGSDKGSEFTARRFRTRLAELGSKHRRGGYGDQDSQAFIESWFGELKEREVWLNEYETLDDARRRIGAYVHPLPPPPAQRARLPAALEVHQTWEDLQATAA